MNKIIHTFIFALICIGLNAQVTFNPEDITKVGTAGEAAIEAKFEVQNTSNGNIDFWWTIDRGANVPKGWEFTICDKNLCYPPGTESINGFDGKENSFTAGESNNAYSVKLVPNGIAECGTVTMRTYSITDTSVVYGTLDITFDLCSSSVFESEYAELSIYPNPTSDYFQIKNGSDISTVSIHNILGKQIESHVHTPSNNYDISGLNGGLYLVRMFDNEGKTVKVVRLNKE